MNAAAATVRRAPAPKPGNGGTPAEKRTIRCAVYTRKSSEEGLAQEFNSLDAQRESAEACVAAQRHEGWVCLPERYDDGGFSGGNIERPALRRLLADVEAGKVDCVVVYKVDRLSRSLLDFARVMQVFDAAGVSFVSVTQQFNTTHSMGRLTLNILLSFAQFEREIIGERIRDKIGAQRRRGQWTGGVPVLGYDVDRTGPSPRLVVNAAEAARARAIFDLYLSHGSLLPVVRELNGRGWTTKARTTRAGKPKGGLAFDKGNLYGLLTNPLYAGRLRHRDQVYAGAHDAVVDPALFDRVQAQLAAHGRGNGGGGVRNRHGALLRGLLRCAGCGRAMTHTFTEKRGKRYRYYTCTRAISGGRAACGSGSLPAGEVERIVVEQVACVGGDAGLANDVLAAARASIDAGLAALATERGELTRELGRHAAAVRALVGAGAGAAHVAGQLVDLDDRTRAAEARVAAVDARARELEAERVTDRDVRRGLADFGALWRELGPREQERALGLLVAKVEFDAAAGTVAVSFHPSGIKALAARADRADANGGDKAKDKERTA